MKDRIAGALDRYLDALLDARVGTSRPGRFDRLFVQSVDSVNRIAACTAGGPDTIYATWQTVLPAAGEYWWAFKKAGGAYILTSVAR